MTSRDKTAFVAGATGFTGREVVRILTEAGIRTLAHVRPDSPQMASWKDRFGMLGAEVDSTPWRQEEMDEAMRRIGPTHIFSLLGTTWKRRRAAAGRGIVESYETVDYGLTAMLVRAVARSIADSRFIYLSAAGAGKIPMSAYFEARRKAEALIRESGLPYTIARPSFITGPGREDGRFLERTAAAISDSLLAAAGLLGGRRLRARYRSTTGAALAASLVRLAFDPEAAFKVVESEDLR